MSQQNAPDAQIPIPRGPVPVAPPPRPRNRVELTLDGQSDTDYYSVYTTGSHRSPRNYVVNVLDTGLENNGQDVKYETDFRAVYSKIIDSWLGGNSVPVLGADFRASAPAIL